MANRDEDQLNTRSPASLNEDVRRIWDAKAAFWDERMGDGNAFQLELIGPAVEGLLAIQPGERVLDVGCGNGVSTRRLAELGAHVLGIDYSARFLELARARVTPHDERIDYLLVDASDEAALLALGEGQFDALVCNMVLMDMADIDPLLRAARQLLTPAGRFVFSIQHPAFNSNDVRLCAEAETAPDGREITTHSVRITDYLTTPAGKGSGMPDEPEPHWYFHRPMHQLFGAFFRAGFVLDGLEEPRFAQDRPDSDDRTLSWFNLPGIPPVLVARCIPRPRPQPENTV
jgi:2-polyprenyl-3-methyl-5-hydroxy-6-metoxy-1,4-benzoquinol methylase